MYGQCLINKNYAEINKFSLRPSLIKTFTETIDFEIIYSSIFSTHGYKTVFLENLYCIILQELSLFQSGPLQATEFHFFQRRSRVPFRR